MSSYSATLKTARMQLVADLISGKTAAASTGTAAAGSLVFLTSANAVLCTIPLSATAGTVTGSTLTLAGLPLSANASSGGTIDHAELRNSSATVIVSAISVGTGAPGTAEVILNTLTVTSGQAVTVSAATITHAA